VAAGSVAIAQPSATQMNITQSSQSAAVNWLGFSIGQGSAVNIAQPNASSAILNRVTGNTPSSIAGSLTANGQVYLVNPNGIAITTSGTVNVGGGFVASTLGISDGDFMSGKRTFTGNGASARVSNAGTISVGRGGYAALIGGTVSNSGSISVPLGKVGLGSGERATLDFSGDGFLQVAVPTNAGGRGALIRNSGSIRANGGSVIISAATARESARNAINISGLVQARSISGHNGSIMIGGGAGGRVKVTGRLIATSRHTAGGSITVTGQHINLKHAVVDASGARGGGTINIGGGRQGTSPLQHADTTSIDKTTTIKADAITSGNGGNITVWSDRLTTFAGAISARGGALAGNGGEAEVSGKARLAYTGFTDLSAANGTFGTLLLDPYNVTISSAADANQSGFTATGDDSFINSTTLQNALAGANVVVSTSSSGNQAGTITLTAPLAWNTGTTLTLLAASEIALNNSINAPAGGLSLSSGGTITATGAISLARFTLTAGNWVQNTATLPGFAVGDFQILGGSFLRATGGTGTSASPYTLADIYGLQGIGSSAAMLAASYTLANDIDATGTSTWGGTQGRASRRSAMLRRTSPACSTATAMWSAG
jgi:filamentous hemagglutinin family protein